MCMISLPRIFLLFFFEATAELILWPIFDEWHVLWWTSTFRKGEQEEEERSRSSFWELQENSTCHGATCRILDIFKTTTLTPLMRMSSYLYLISLSLSLSFHDSAWKKFWRVSLSSWIYLKLFFAGTKMLGDNVISLRDHNKWLGGIHWINFRKTL